MAGMFTLFAAEFVIRLVPPRHLRVLLTIIMSCLPGNLHA